MNEESMQTKTGRAWMRPWIRRLLITAALFALYRLGTSIPLPGALDILWMPESLRERAMPAGLPYMERFFLFGLGIMPYLSASVILLLLSGIIPGLRRWRDSNGAQHAAFARTLLALAGGLAAIQGIGVAIHCEYLRTKLSLPPPESSFAFRAMITSVLVVGTMVTVWIVHLISRHGIGNGVAILLLCTWVEGIPSSARATFKPMRPDAPSPLFATALFLAAVLFAIILVTAQRRIRLAKPDRPDALPDPLDPRHIALRLQPAGSAPLVAAATVIASATTVATLLASGRSSQSMPVIRILTFLSPVIAIIFSILFASWLFNPRDLTERLSRRGLYPVDDEGRPLERGDLERAQERMAWFGAGLLCLYALVGVGISRSDSLASGFCGLIDASLILSVAVILQIASNIRVWRAAPAGGSWTLVKRFDVGLDAKLAVARLHGGRMTAVIHDSSPGVLLGSPAPWEQCRPYYPALVIYGRLGGGGAEVWVPSEVASGARLLLSLREDSEMQATEDRCIRSLM